MPSFDSRPHTVLVTGGKGFIGARVVRRLVECGYRVVCFDLRATPGRLGEALANRVTMVDGDIVSYDAIARAIADHGADCIAHMVFFSAEERGVASRPEEADQLYRQQMIMNTGTFHVFEAARKAGINRVLFPSSVQYHGLDEPWTEAEPVTEESPPRPTTPYGIGKHLCERIAREYNRLHGMEIVTVRVPGAYGPGVRIGARGVNLIGTAGAVGEPVRLPYPPAQHAVLAHVDDIANIAVRVLTGPRPAHDVYHIGGHYTSYRELADLGRKLVPGMDVRFDEDTAVTCSYRIDSSLMTRDLGITHRSLERGYGELINEVRAEHGLAPIAIPAST